MKFRPSLFWDANLKKLNYQDKAEFIIGRVLDFGNLEEWKAIQGFYGLSKIKTVAKKHIFSDIRSANFWALILNIPLKDLQCTKNPSLKIPKAFLSC